MLKLQLFEAFGDIYLKTARYDATMKKVMASIKKVPAKINVDIAVGITGLAAAEAQLKAFRASAATPIRFNFASGGLATTAIGLLMQQVASLRRGAGATIPVRADLRPWKAAMKTVAADIARVRRSATIPISANTSRARSGVNQLIARLRVAQKAARINVTTSRPAFGGGGMGGGGFLSGAAQGLGLPFTGGNPLAAAGFLAGKGATDAVGTAVELQTTFADLRRITGATAVKMDEFKASLFDISTKQAGVGISDLTEIAGIGARMGVADREGMGGLSQFTQQVAMVKNAISDVPTEELANSMGRVLNVFDLGTERIAGFGSALTAMDNVSTASARDILAITTGLSGTAAAIGMTLPQVLAFSSVLKDVGLTNQLAASSFSQIFRLMASDSEGFAEKVGVDAKKFRRAYENDVMGALQMVVDKFDEIGKTGSVAQQEWLAELGLKGVRTAGSFQQLATRIGDVAERAKVASAETSTLNALTSANALKSETAAASFTKFKNAATELGDALGTVLLPTITDMTNAATVMTKALSGGAPGFLKKWLQIKLGGMDEEGKNETRVEMEDQAAGILGMKMSLPGNNWGMPGGKHAAAGQLAPLPASGAPAPLLAEAVRKALALQIDDDRAAGKFPADATDDEKEAEVFARAAGIAKANADLKKAAILATEAVRLGGEGALVGLEPNFMAKVGAKAPAVPDAAAAPINAAVQAAAAKLNAAPVNAAVQAAGEKLNRAGQVAGAAGDNLAGDIEGGDFGERIAKAAEASAKTLALLLEQVIAQKPKGNPGAILG